MKVSARPPARRGGAARKWAAERRLVLATGLDDVLTPDSPRRDTLARELLVTEYPAAFGQHTVVNRCGVIAGPWQMGRVDQGVFI
ncbi:MAG: hypothetical protein H0T69_06985 [Thermoleophilaceae bacterium]|nr:hypothetical protein [Thermoleophilaceae bacterium]